jgi:hypothetical protein
MPNKSFHVQDLEKEIEGLTGTLHAADTEIGRLELVIEQLVEDELVLTAKLTDALNEIGRLDIVVFQQKQNLESI